MAGLDTGIPIGRRKRNVPEARCGLWNFTATWGGPIRPFFMETTRHSKCCPLFWFCTWSFCLGTTMSVKAISAPCALTTSVCVLS